MKNFLREWGLIIGIFVVLILSRLFVWGQVIVDGHSMDPNLANNQRLIVLKVAQPKRFDIVVAHETNPSKDIVKRVIGLPGDTITYDHDQLTINGKKYSEPYLADFKKQLSDGKLEKTYAAYPLSDTVTKANRAAFVTMAQSTAAFTTNSLNNPTFTIKVPAGDYFLMGDNRVISADSRSVGPFKRSQILGVAKLRIWPLDKIGLIK